MKMSAVLVEFAEPEAPDQNRPLINGTPWLAMTLATVLSRH
ncbi:hypothetical protein [Paraburkholderia tropica]|jgi:hypothetical protein|nr:hypothetical protein [Paraburkholderia tropica]